MQHQVIKAQDDQHAAELASIAIYHHLFIDGWSLIEVLQDVVTKPERFAIALALVDETPVGVCVMEDFSYVSNFVHPEFRQQGIASNLFTMLQVDSMCECVIGEPQSRFLFEKFKVFIHEQ